MHPTTVFISKCIAVDFEHYVEDIRHPKKPAPKHTQIEEDDKLEGPLHVPKSVLDGCESGFIVADDQWQKASTQFFDDTALMALLC